MFKVNMPIVIEVVSKQTKSRPIKNNQWTKSKPTSEEKKTNNLKRLFKYVIIRKGHFIDLHHLKQTWIVVFIEKNNS